MSDVYSILRELTATQQEAAAESISRAHPCMLLIQNAYEQHQRILYTLGYHQIF